VVGKEDYQWDQQNRANQGQYQIVFHRQQQQPAHHHQHNQQQYDDHVVEKHHNDTSRSHHTLEGEDEINDIGGLEACNEFLAPSISVRLPDPPRPLHPSLHPMSHTNLKTTRGTTTTTPTRTISFSNLAVDGGWVRPSLALHDLAQGSVEREASST